MIKNRYRGYLFVILSAVIFGCMPFMAKGFIYPDGVSAPSLVLWRNLLALPTLAVLSLIEGKTLAVKRSELARLFLVSVFGCCLTPVLLFSSYNYIPSGTATVFHFIYPALTVVGGILFLKKKAQTVSLVSVAVALVGIFMFFDPSAPLDMRGVAIAVLSGVTFATYILMISSHKDGPTGFLFTFYIALFGTAVMLGYCLATDSLTFPSSAVGWVAVAVFAQAVTVGAVVLFQQGTMLIGGERASILSTVEPITGVIIGVTVFSEPVTAASVIGSVLVIAASIMIAISDNKKTK